jgi:hypothetical protein
MAVAKLVAEAGCGHPDVDFNRRNHDKSPLLKLLWWQIDGGAIGRIYSSIRAWGHFGL